MNEISRIKAFFFDLDGTLLDEKQGRLFGISKANIEAVKNLSQKSLVVVSTGRPNLQFSKQRKEMGIDYTITGNGALIYDKNDKLIDSTYMPKKIGDKLINFLKSKNIPTKINTKNVVYGKKFYIGWIVRFFQYENHSWDLFTTPENYVKATIFALKKRIRKLYPQIVEQFSNLEITIAGHNHVIEVTDKKATKGLGALKILKKENIESKFAAHFGDTLNDASAMKELGYGFTFEDSDKEIKPFANFIGPKFKNGGVAKILNGGYKKNNG